MDGRGQRILYMNPLQLFAERLRIGPFNLAHRISWNPYQSYHVMMDEDEFWNYERAQDDISFSSLDGPWELFTDRLRTGPFNISHRILLNTYRPFQMMMDEEELWGHGRVMSPTWQHFVRASPIDFSNRFNDDYGSRQLTSGEVETVLQKIKREVYTPLSENSEEGNKEKEESDPIPHTCSICLEDFSAEQQLLCLPCKHKFHSECLMPWIKRKGQCPVCRLDLTGRPASVNNIDQPQMWEVRWR